MTTALSRRRVVGALMGYVTPIPVFASADYGTTIDGSGVAELIVGDQRGATRSILKAAGQLDDLPYRIQWSFFPVGAPLITAISVGAIDFGYVGDATATFAFASGRPLKVITVWKMDGTGSAIVVPKTSAARSMRDLVGRRVAFVKGSPGHLLVVAALKREGLTLDQIVATPLSAANARTALASGAIDAWAIWDPYIATVELEDHARILLNARGVIREVECGVANEDVISQKRSLLLDFMQRVNRSIAWGDSHHEERSQAFSRDTGVPIDIARLTSSRLAITPLGRIDEDAIATHQHVADLYQAAGVVPSRVDVAQFYDRSFNIGG